MQFAATVEIAFDSGFRTPAADRTWVDVSEYVYNEIPITWGRPDKFSTCQPLTCSVTLDNSDGAFTAAYPSSPYYPNVRLFRPIRVTITPEGGSPSVRFMGYVDSWPTEWPNGTDMQSLVTVTAVSRSSVLALQNTLRSILTQSALLAGGSVWPMSDPAQGGKVADVAKLLGVMASAGAGAAINFGASGAEFAGGKYLTSSVPISTLACSFGVSFATSDPNGGEHLLPVTTGARALLAAGDGHDHRLLITCGGAGGNSAYLDGVDLLSLHVDLTSTVLGICQPWGGARPAATCWDLTYYPTELSSSDAAEEYRMFRGAIGDTTDAALELVASFVGIESAEVNADAGATTVGSLDTRGQSALDAFRTIESTEGGVLTDNRDGTLRLLGRRFRYSTSPVVSLSMADEDVEQGYSPTLDRSLLRNDWTGTNVATDLGDSVSFRVTDDASIDEYGVSGGSTEVNASDPLEANAAASWVVANNAEPAPRVPTLAVDLRALGDLTKVEACMAAFIGDRVEVTDRPAQDSTDSAVFFIEGGSETWSADTASLSWATSAVRLEDSILIINGGASGMLDSGRYIGY